MIVSMLLSAVSFSRAVSRRMVSPPLSTPASISDISAMQ